MDGRIRVRDAIQSGRIAEAVATVHQLHPELLDDDRRLFFLLQQQQLIEVRSRLCFLNLLRNESNLLVDNDFIMSLAINELA